MKLPEFDDCLKRGRIIRFPAAKKLAAKELDVAREDLLTAQQSLKQKNFKWATYKRITPCFMRREPFCIIRDTGRKVIIA